jgi:UDPglucose 6-dehydrogenase
LPTPFYKDAYGKQDLSILEGAISEINTLAQDGQTVVIKSTVVPGTNRAFQNRFPKLRFVSNPEFLSASSARVDFICAARNILGGQAEDVEKVDALYKHRFGNSLLTFKTSWEAAELTKYLSNLFFATKLSYFNFAHSVCEKMGLDYNEVRDMVVSDSRIGRSHDKVPGTDNKKGWGSFCFPKDMLAFISFVHDLDLDPKLLQAAWDQNLEDRGEPDWEKLGPSVMSYKYKDDKIEKIAKTAYRFNGGVDKEREDYNDIFGILPKKWEELEQWERDEYRYQALRILETIKRDCQ